MRFTLCLALTLALAACATERNPPLPVDAAVVALDALPDVAPLVDATPRDVFDVGGAQPCTAGRVEECPCGDGRRGTQTCQPTGVFGACVCADAAVARPDVVVPREDVPPADVGCLDFDLDGYGPGCEFGPDCNDGDRTIHPGAMEICDGIDQNCDGNADTVPSDAGGVVRDPATNAYCEQILVPDGGTWDMPPRCVVPGLPTWQRICPGPVSVPMCIACTGRRCFGRGPEVVAAQCMLP